MLPGDNPWGLPANIDHEIRALTDGTVVVNMAVGEAHATGVAADPARNGGVTLVDAA
jgi:hypothetical protein